VKVREPVARPLDVIAAELLLSISQAFVVGVLLYVAVGVWSERGVDSGSIAAILIAMAFVVGGGWLYWLLGGIGLPLAAAELPVAIFLTAAALFGLRGDPIIGLEPFALILTLVASVYGIAAGVFLDSPRRLRWDQRRTRRRQDPVPRVSPATAAAMARMRGVRDSATSRSTAPTPPRASAPPATTSTSPEPVSTAEGTRPPPAPETPRPAPTIAAPAVPAKPVTPTRPPGRPPTSSSASSRTTAATDPDPLELPTSVEPRAQKSPWAWARPPEWNREEETFDDDREDERG
jgi:hypothetical protein